MKHLRNLLLSICLVFSIFGIVFTPNALAQTEAPHEDTPYETAYKDYVKQTEEYQVAHDDYVLRRSQYLRFKTLQSQQDAFNATVKMLQERDDVVISYINALKERLAEADGVSDSVKSSLNVKIAAETGWFNDHKNKLSSAGTLDDLVTDSRIARDRFNIEYPLFYEILSDVSSGKITDFDVRLKDVFDQLKRKIDEIKAEQRDEYKLSEDKLLQLDRWVFDADNRIDRAEEKQQDALKVEATIIGQKDKALSIYNTVLLRLTESQQFLKEAGSYLIEIVRAIKTKEE